MNKTKITGTLGPGTVIKEKIVEQSLDCDAILAAGVRHQRQTVTIDATTGHITYGSLSIR